MAKWLCGAMIQSSGPVPNPAEYLLVSDVDFDGFTGFVEAEDVYMAMTHAFRCASCDRLHVFWSGMGIPRFTHLSRRRPTRQTGRAPSRRGAASFLGVTVPATPILGIMPDPA
jgi:hypothetical protein